MKNVIVVGLGEVGKAIYRIEEEHNYVTGLDKNCEGRTIQKDIDIMHICIPYDKFFIDIVINYIKEIKPKLTIIHSTVKPGITDYISDYTCACVVHSPIRGIHPYLYEGIKTFIKYVGGEKEACIIANEHLKSLGIKTTTPMTSKETEFLKILDTTYYGWNIMYADFVNELCKDNNLNYDNVYTIANKDYNDGYTELGKKNVIRPVLYPPEKGIGGHCVIENILILLPFSPERCKEMLKVGKDSKNPIEDKAFLACEYIGKNKSASKIGRELNVSHNVVNYKLKQFGLKKIKKAIK
jgi:hypothetical protein